MIETIHQLMVELKNKGLSEIEPFSNIGHNPTIGSMYEGLTKKLVEKTIFKDIDLRVTSGKITNTRGQFSDQIDCMIVVGEGKKIPFTNESIYDVNNVIAVIEVKKNLFSKEISSAYDNLKSVSNIATPEHDIPVNMVRDAFTAISKQELPDHNNVKNLDTKYQLLYHSIVVECLLPLRIIFGYNGFTDEYSLRENFIKYMENMQDPQTGAAKGFGATSLPNLIIAKDNSLVKTNGMPYAITLSDESYCWMASYRCNPLLIFLELLWTRLTYMFGLSIDIFGENLVLENLAPLLVANGTDKGWQYRVINYTLNDLKNLGTNTEWAPSVLSEAEFIIMNKLCNEEELSIDNISCLVKTYNNEDIYDIVSHLSNERLIYTENGEIKLLTSQCKVAIIPELGYCAAEDKDGRFTKWINQYMKRRSS